MNKQIINHKTQITLRGMSLIEALVWVAVLSIILSAIVAGILQIYKSNNHILQRAIAVMSARKGMEESVRLIRTASYSDSGAYPLVSFSDNSIQIYTDKDNDGSVELVRIYLDNSNLNIGVIEPEGVPAEYNGAEVVNTLVSDIRNTTLGVSLFKYYNKDGLEVINQSSILDPVYIKVHLIANTGKEPTVNDYELRGSAFMRNLKN